MHRFSFIRTSKYKIRHGNEKFAILQIVTERLRDNVFQTRLKSDKFIFTEQLAML